MSDLIQLDQVGEKQSREQAEFLRERVADLLQARHKGFPGAQPVSFAQRHFKALCDSDYYLCEKTDGIRCLLYLTFYTDQNPENGQMEKREAAFLIDRKNDYYHINNESFHFPLPDRPTESFHTETLADGELVLDIMPDGSRVRRYLVFDCLALDGNVLIKRTLDKRMGYFHDNVLRPYNKLLDDFPQERAFQPFVITMKKMEKAYGIVMMFKDILPSLPHGNDGLVFTRRDTPYVTGTDQNIIKWKPPHENTIDFRLQIGLFPPLPPDESSDLPPEGHIDGHDYDPDYDACPELRLLVFKGNKQNEFFAKMYVTDDEWAAMKSIGQPLDARIIECYKDDQQRWRFKKEQDGSPRFRDDKTEANHISTVDSVLESIEDAVSESDLVARDVSIKNAWKEREVRIRQQQQQAQEQEMRRRKAMEEEAKRRQAAA